MWSKQFLIKLSPDEVSLSMMEIEVVSTTKLLIAINIDQNQSCTFKP